MGLNITKGDLITKSSENDFIVGASDTAPVVENDDYFEVTPGAKKIKMTTAGEYLAKDIVVNTGTQVFESTSTPTSSDGRNGNYWFIKE